MIDDLVWFLRRSGLVYQSVEAVRPILPRWERHLRARGHTAVPDLAYARWWSPAEVRAGNDVNRLINQAAKNQAMAHQLRNLTGIRPYKP